MRWIIKHNPSGKYLCSKQTTVFNREFARKFNSVRQARIFLNGSSFMKNQCSVIEYYRDIPGNNVQYSEKEIAKRIFDNLYTLNDIN